MAANSASSLSEIWGEIQRAAGALERILELLNQPYGLRLISAPQIIPAADAGFVRFDNLYFNYPSRPDYATLKQFDLNLTPGESVALVGPSGADKTTVMQLLLRFYKPQQGKITLGGIDIAQADIHQLRSLIGIVPQETVVFAATVKENIRLSGGQRQRIAIARALLKNPPVLLLDEATSALNTESEQLVQQALNKLMHNRTTLIIAHRLATVVKADRIVAMEHGRHRHTPGFVNPERFICSTGEIAIQ